jgi:formate hydrogenlyase subunit 3/multisubunit Na+/H+ antiporter MnhD subunit
MHIVLYRISRKIRKWISVAGAFGIFICCFYIIAGGNSVFSSWDIMSGIFAVLISFVSLCSVWYSQEYNPEANFVYDSLLFLFIGSMLGVVLSRYLILFYIFWEMMTVSGFFLILYLNNEEARASSVKYLIMAGTGSVFLLFGIISVLSGVTNTESLFLKNLVFFCILIGTGVKIGIIPLHSWLPDAHPAAPTPVSAMLSGVMIKTGVYAFVLFYFRIFSPGWSVTWEQILLLLGVITLLGGVLFALVQHDIKRLLAYHSISQIGYVFLGIACGTQLGLVGGIYHVVNHAVFKSLLFLGAGVLIKKTGSRNLEDYGGLSNKLPFTFLVMLIASLSISGIPPFNGFVSKWLIYQALLEKGTVITSIFMGIAVLGSVLTFGSFAKVLNDSFMGVRKIEIEKTTDGPLTRIPMGTLAFLCLVMGIFPGFMVYKILLPAINSSPEAVNIKLINMASFYGWLLVLILFMLFVLGRKWINKLKKSDIFIGGETIERELTEFDGSQFYLTIKETPVMNKIYRWEEKGYFDLYLLFGKISHRITAGIKNFELALTDFLYKKFREYVIEKLIHKFKTWHNAVLAKYILWIFAGIVFIMEVLRR